MKRQSIFLILLLSFILSVTCGCSASQKSDAAVPQTASDISTEGKAAGAEESSPEDAAVPEQADTYGSTPPAEDSEDRLIEDPPSKAELKERIETQQNEAIEEKAENVVGVFEGLEDNHTAIFSFDGAESTFYFEDPAVQTVLSEAVIGSSYTLSYQFDPSLGLVCIYDITEN